MDELNNTGLPEGTSSSGEFDVNAIIAEAERDNASPAEQTPVIAPEQYEFKANGRAVKATREQMLQYASQGYGANTKIGELNKRLVDFESKQKTYDEKYGAIDEYVRQNPKFWDHVTNTWQTARDAQASPITEHTVPPQIIERLQKAESYIQTQAEKEAAQVIEQEDAKLNEHIQSFREQYKDLDWNTPDENGHNLELQVLNFASQRGIKDFETAFKASQYDNLLKRAEERGKEQVAKERVQNGKLGLLGKTTTQAPAKEPGIKQYRRGQSDNDILNEALKELGIN